MGAHNGLHKSTGSGLAGLPTHKPPQSLELSSLPPHLPSPGLKVILVALLLILNCVTSAVASISSPKNTAAVALAAECMKAVASLALLVREQGMDRSKAQKLVESFSLTTSAGMGLFSVAALYAAVNNCFMLALQYINIHTYQILFSLRIPVTAMFMLVFLGKHFSPLQCLAAALLFGGAALSQADLHQFEWVQTPKLGLVYVGIMVGASSAAGVLNEAILKKDDLGSLHAKNLQLYIYGLCINLACSLAGFTKTRVPLTESFQGLSMSSHALAALLAAQGLVTSAVIKYTDNIVKAGTAVGSIGVSAAIAFLVFGSPMTVESVCGSALASVALALYLW